ncbi:MAG: TspO/MBR family protein [Elusimicrobiota bacterium]
MKIKWVKLILSILMCQGAGLIGSIFTGQSVNTWYPTITKPSFTPPNWIFAPVWTILFILLGVSFYFVWIKKTEKQKSKAFTIFFIQLGLNILWSAVFFGMRSPLGGLIVIVFLWTAIFITINKFKPISLTSAWLLAPYFSWVSFAAVLNYSIFILNR